MKKEIERKGLNRFYKRMVLKKYYTSKIKSGKGLYASLIDYFITAVVFFSVMFVLIYSISNKLLISVLLDSLFLSFYISIVYMKNKKMKDKKIREINDEIVNKQLIKKISKYSNQDFLLTMKEMLERYYNTTFHEHGKYIDFIGEINGDIYAVKCLKNPIETYVSFRDLENFILEAESKNIQEGIIITSSYFSDEVKERLNYILIDFEKIKGIMKEIGDYPTKKGIEDYIVSNYNYKKENVKKAIKNKDKDRAYKFLLLSIVLYVFSYFVPYKTYYRIISLLSLLVGTGLALYNMVIYIERTQKDI